MNLMFKSDPSNGRIDESLGLTQERGEELCENLKSISDDPSITSITQVLEGLSQVASTPAELAFISLQYGYSIGQSNQPNARIHKN